MVKVSVLIPTYYPDLDIFRRVLDALESQSLSSEFWELIIVASGTPTAYIEQISDLQWKKNFKIIHEPTPGLTRARIRAIEEAQGDLLIFVDDDNILEETYLEKTVFLMDMQKDVVVAGGLIKAEYQASPPPWILKYSSVLAIRDFGDANIISDCRKMVSSYPDFSPIGAGMVLRREVAEGYAHDCSLDILDRTGSSLSSGGDNDIVLYCLKNFGEAAYFPELVLNHLIPKKRIDPNYLARLNYSSSRSWVYVLNKYGLCTWSKLSSQGALARKIISFFKHTAWLSAESYFIWSGVCGHYDGRVDLGKSEVLK